MGSSKKVSPFPRKTGRPRKELPPPEPTGTIEATNVFYKNLACKAPTVVNRGGAGSSKSYSLAQLFAYKFFTERAKKFLIVRKTLPSLRLSTLLDWYTILGSVGLRSEVEEEKVSLNFFYGDNLVHFGSIDDPEKIKCYSPDTEVLTKEGFKLVGDVKIGELVATMNPATRKAEYRKVTNRWEYEFNGEMISPCSQSGIRDSHVGFCVTPEHKMLIEKRSGKAGLQYAKAQDLPSEFLVPRSAEWDGKKVEFYDIPRGEGRKSTRFPIVPWLKFLGWYLSEGNLGPNRDIIYISQTKEDGKRKIREDLADFPYKVTEGKTDFSICSRDLCKYLEGLGLYCYEKGIPRDILELHPSLLQHLFDSLMAGDGTRLKSGRFSYTTSSEKLKDGVCELAIKLGMVPLVQYMGDYVRDNPEKYFPNARPYWNLSISKKRNSRVSKTKKVPYSGKVHCIEVPPYHNILTRQNGRVMWCGQSTNWNYIWIEEATEFTYEDYQQCKLRLRAPSVDGHPNQIFLSFNPIDEFHWIKEKVVEEPTEDSQEIHSTYKDNPFLPDEYIKELKILEFQDPSFFNIYTLGFWGRLENIIYRQGTHWDLCTSMPSVSEVDKVIYGLDFGFNAPAALTRIMFKGKEVWEEELLYAKGLTNSQLMAKTAKLIHKKGARIYADSAEPDRIQEFRNNGFSGIRPAVKNVVDGIDLVKVYHLNVLNTSSNLLKEKRSYSWRKDRQGRVLDEPIDFLNHLMDAERYAIYSDKRGFGLRVRMVN